MQETLQWFSRGVVTRNETGLPIRSGPWCNGAWSTAAESEQHLYILWHTAVANHGESCETLV